MHILNILVKKYCFDTGYDRINVKETNSLKILSKILPIVQSSILENISLYKDEEIDLI